jgi:DNA-binding NarL/FixJ family response regulator
MDTVTYLSIRFEIRRETEILNYIAQGYLNKQIAAELEVSNQTIKITLLQSCEN